MKNGFFRIAVVEPKLKLANIKHNTQCSLELLEILPRDVDLICFTPFSATGNTIGHLFKDSLVIEEQKIFIQEISNWCKQRKKKAIVSIVDSSDVLKNLGVIEDRFEYKKEPLEFLGIFDEEGVFNILKTENAENNRYLTITINDDIKIVWEMTPQYADEESMHNHACRIASRNRTLTMIRSSRYESTSFNVFLGEHGFYELGEKLAAEVKESKYGRIYMADFDLERVKGHKRRNTVDIENESSIRETFFEGYFDLEFRILYRNFPCLYFFSPELREKLGNQEYDSLLENAFSTRDEFSQYYERILEMASWGLARRIEFLGDKTKVILGLSGGLDSTCALLIAKRAFAILGRSISDLLVISMPGLGTSDITKSNAFKLADAIKCSFKEIPINEAVIKHLESIGHDINKKDVTFENAQARERTQILMDMANRVGGFVLGTGDLSEIAIGFSTYNGDHISMYNVNSSIPKSLMRLLVAHEAQCQPELSDILRAIVATPVSPELLPPTQDGEIKQQTEKIVGSYELIDFFLYHHQNYYMSPRDILYRAYLTFNEKYELSEIYSSLVSFYKRMISSQFKRNCSSDGAAVQSVHLAPQGDGFMMPSDADVSLWLQDLDDIKEFYM